MELFVTLCNFLSGKSKEDLPSIVKRTIDGKAFQSYLADIFVKLFS